MRLNRRTLLGMLAAAPAAAALAGRVEMAQAAEPDASESGSATDHTFEWDCAQYERPLWRCGNCYRPDYEHAVVKNPGDDAYQHGFNQGKADGYNRGREVEMARQESRLWADVYADTTYTRTPGLLTPTATWVKTGEVGPDVPILYRMEV